MQQLTFIVCLTLLVNGAVSQPRSCRDGGQDQCSPNGLCRDYDRGYCCECQEGYYGNGINCLSADVAQRINGKIAGTINGVPIADMDLHVYVVTKEGRVYTAVSVTPVTIGYAMQALYPIGSAMAWMFAKPSAERVKNGFMITGGVFNSSSTLRFTNGGTVHIQQNCMGLDDEGMLRMSTVLNGNLPNILSEANFEVPDYVEVYQRTGRGLIQSSSTHTYTIDQIPYTMSVDHQISYTECSSAPLDELPDLSVDISRTFVVYDPKQQISRYATTNQITESTVDINDPCTQARCDRNARCTATHDTYTCTCKEGFHGSGEVCQDIDECAYNRHDCDRNAECVNREGSYECRCRQGFRGDGRTCTQEMTCEQLNCDPRARCEYSTSTGQPSCQCPPGYRGDGTYCEREEFDCNEVNNCDDYADCIYDPAVSRYRCECAEGYVGDGYTCTADSGCNVANNCDENARCTYDELRRQYACRCNPGFRGDGYRCMAEGCDVTNNCDRNAQCLYNRQQGRYACQCNDGYEGDGIQCTQTSEPCNRVNNCDINADCLYEATYGSYQCRCRQGYSGDGYSCRLEADCRRDRSICDVNARCEQRALDYVCVCNAGFHGDGSTCAPIGDNPTYLMFTQGMSIMQLPFSPSATDPGKQTLLIPGQTAIGLAVDCYSRYFYWTDVVGKTISRARLDGTDSQVLVRGLNSPEGVAIDWMSRNMYWTDSGSDSIEVANLDGSQRRVLFDRDLVNPRAIVVDPIRGLIFWTDWNRKAPKIESAEMDGSNRQVIVSEGLGLPNGLTIDYRSNQICWADAGTTNIECVNYEGRARRVIYEQASYPFGIAYADDVFYWTDWDMRSLPSINNREGATLNEPIPLPEGGNGKMYGIAVVPRACPRGNNACSLNNGGCRFLCLPTGSRGRTCACPDDIEPEECNRIARL